MNNLFEMIFNSLPLPMWVKDLNYRYIVVNNSFSELCNRNKEQTINQNEDIFLAESMEVLESKEAKLFCITMGEIIRECFIFPIMDDNKEVVAVCGLILDENTNKANSLVGQIIDILPGVIFCKDKNGRYVYANKGCRDFYKEKDIDNILGKTDEEINENIELVKKFREDDEKIIKSKSTIYNEAVFINKNGEKSYKEVVKIPLIDSKGNVSGIVGRSMDVTEKRIAQEKLRYISYTDILTEVYNRAFFEERIKELEKKEYLPLGVIMGDTNGLKKINDTHGHQMGDSLLKYTAKILVDACKGSGEVFRIGGDEFAILVKNTSTQECEKIISKINKMCSEFELNLYDISISLGYAIKYNKENNILKVLKEADDKVYIEKAKLKKL